MRFVKSKVSVILYLLGFILFTLFYNEVRPFYVDGFVHALFVTCLAGGSVMGVIQLLRKFQKQNLFWLFVLLIFIFKLFQGYFDPEDIHDYHGFNYAYYVLSVFIVTFYWIKK